MIRADVMHRMIADKLKAIDATDQKKARQELATNLLGLLNGLALCDKLSPKEFEAYNARTWQAFMRN